jgi:hypothetical protein
VIAEYERAKIMERCRRGRLHKARSGSVSALAQAPYGYRYVRKTDHEPARFEIDDHQARIVRQIFRWLVEEEGSLYEITRRLSSMGEPTKTGRLRWDRATVWYIVKNPVYMGQAAFGKTVAVPRGKRLRPKTIAPRHTNSSREDRSPSDWASIPVLAIVPPEVFAAAQEQLARNTKLAQRHARGERYLLQGLLQCACCRFAFVGFTTKRASGKQYAFYRCCANDRARVWGKTVCTNSYVRAEQLDAYVWDCVRQLLADPHRILDEWTRRGSEDGLVAELKTQRCGSSLQDIEGEHTIAQGIYGQLINGCDTRECEQTPAVNIPVFLFATRPTSETQAFDQTTSSNASGLFELEVAPGAQVLCRGHFNDYEQRYFFGPCIEVAVPVGTVRHDHASGPGGGQWYPGDNFFIPVP